MFWKRGVLRNLQNSQENTCARVSFLIKLQTFLFTQSTSGGCFWVYFQKKYFVIAEPTFCFKDMIESWINPFLSSVPILYPLKTPKNFWFFDVFRGYEVGTLTRNGLKSLLETVILIFISYLLSKTWDKLEIAWGRLGAVFASLLLPEKLFMAHLKSYQ